MKKHLSDCHEAPVVVVGGDEGTNHYECTYCGNACDIRSEYDDTKPDTAVEATDEAYLYSTSQAKTSHTGKLRDILQEVYNAGTADYSDPIVLAQAQIIELIEGLIPEKRVHPNPELPAEKYWIFGHNQATADIRSRLETLREEP